MALVVTRQTAAALGGRAAQSVSAAAAAKAAQAAKAQADAQAAYAQQVAAAQAQAQARAQAQQQAQAQAAYAQQQQAAQDAAKAQAQQQAQAQAAADKRAADAQTRAKVLPTKISLAESPALGTLPPTGGLDVIGGGTPPPTSAATPSPASGTDPHLIDPTKPIVNPNKPPVVGEVYVPPSGGTAPATIPSNTDVDRMRFVSKYGVVPSDQELKNFINTGNREGTPLPLPGVPTGPVGTTGRPGDATGAGPPLQGAGGVYVPPVGPTAPTQATAIGGIAETPHQDATPSQGGAAPIPGTPLGPPDTRTVGIRTLGQAPPGSVPVIPFVPPPFTPSPGGTTPPPPPLPNPIDAAAGRRGPNGETPQQMAVLGFGWNPSTNTWEKKGSGAAPVNAPSTGGLPPAPPGIDPVIWAEIQKAKASRGTGPPSQAEIDANTATALKAEDVAPQVGGIRLTPTDLANAPASYQGPFVQTGSGAAPVNGVLPDGSGTDTHQTPSLGQWKANLLANPTQTLDWNTIDPSIRQQLSYWVNNDPEYNYRYDVAHGSPGQGSGPANQLPATQPNQPANQPPLLSETPDTGVSPGGGGTNAGVSPPGGVTGTPGSTEGAATDGGLNDTFVRIVDALNSGTLIAATDWAKLSPDIQAQLQQYYPNMNLETTGDSGTSPPTERTTSPPTGGTSPPADGTTPPATGGATPPPPGGTIPTPPGGATPPPATGNVNLDQQISDMVGQLRVNAQSEKENLHRQYDEQRVRLARQFSIDPSGQDQGKAIRDFEELGSAEANALAAVDAKVRDETRTNIATLLNIEQSQSQIGIAGRAQTLAETSATAQQKLAQEQAYGGTQAISAQSLGVSVDFKNPDGTNNFDKWPQAVDALTRNFNQQYGQDPTQQEMQTLLSGGTIPARQTLAAQQLALEQGKATGVVGGQKTLEAQQLDVSKQQFDSTFLGQMTDATGQITKDANGNPLSSLDAQRLNQAKSEFDQNINLQKQDLALKVGSTWAQITGSTGTPAPVSAQDLGVDLSNITKSPLPPGALMVTPEASALRASFKAMTGKDATPQQVLDLLQGKSLNVPGAPTLEARKLASDITTATLNREADLKKTAESVGLGYAQLKQLTDQTDKEWALKTEDVAKRSDLDAMKFKQAQMELDHSIDLSERQFANNAGMAWAQITGTTGTPGPVDAKALGVDTSKVSGYNTPQALLQSPEAQQLRERINAMVGTTPTDDQIAQLLQGGKIQVANTPTLEATKTAAQINQIAAAQGLDVRKFAEASRQFNTEFTLSKNQITQQMGITKDQADAALAKETDQQAREKLYWDGLLNGARSPIKIDLSSPDSTPMGPDGKPMFDQKKLVQERVAQQIATRDGKTISTPEIDKLRTYLASAIGNNQQPTDEQVNLLIAGKPLTIQALGKNWYSTFTTDQRKEILALISGGQSFQSQPGLAQIVGQFLGALAPSLATVLLG